MANEKKVAREPSFLLALVPIVAMIGFMLYCFLGHSESGYHDAHLPLVMSIIVACIVGHFCGHDFKDMLSGMIERLSASMEAVLILCTVGFLVSSFMASGAIPSLIVYGLDLLTPKLFLPVGCILCAIVGMACGSSHYHGGKFCIKPAVGVPKKGGRTPGGRIKPIYKCFALC